MDSKNASPELLILRVAGRRIAVCDIQDASRVYGEIWMRAAAGGRCIRGAEVFNGDVQIARISQNGRVWPMAEWHVGMRPICEAVAA